jgi:hypothetical protein
MEPWGGGAALVKLALLAYLGAHRAPLGGAALGVRSNPEDTRAASVVGAAAVHPQTRMSGGIHSGAAGTLRCGGRARRAGRS